MTLPIPHYELSRHRTWCVTRGHPGTTFNPLLNRTWCACGEITTDGDTATHDLCCGNLPIRPDTPTVASAIAEALEGAA